MKIAFYINNKGTSSVDCIDLTKGNPGIGGTEYSMLLVASYLSQNKKSSFDFLVLANSICNLPEHISAIKADSVQEAMDIASSKGVSCFVLRYHCDYLREGILDLPSAKAMKIIIHAHNFFNRHYLNHFQHYDNVYLVNVGREQLDAYRDHPMYQRSTFIFNGMYFDEYVENKNRSRDVVYIGSLTKEKCADYLTGIWKRVKESVPDAKLHIIGSGKLYSRYNKLGPFNLAEEEFEAQLIKPILTDEGNIDESVIFHGVMGLEKKDILKTSKVGVPNPGGIGETFGYTAVEMQWYGCSVTTAKVPGYMDTVYDKRQLYDDINKLAGNIVTLLGTEVAENSIELKRYLKDNFSIEAVCVKWNELFVNLMKNRSISNEKSVMVNRTFQLKWLRELNRRIKIVLPFLPTIALWEYYFIKIKRFLFVKILNKRLSPIDEDRLERISG